MQRKYIWELWGVSALECMFWCVAGVGVDGKGLMERTVKAGDCYRRSLTIYIYIRKVGKCGWGMGTHLLSACLYETHKSTSPWRHISGLVGALVNWLYAVQCCLRIGKSFRYSGISDAFMEPEGSLPCSQEPATGLYYTTHLHRIP
jgi:hypothetical protein